LENRGGQDDEMSGGMWEAVETSTRKIRVGKIEGRRGKRGSREEEGGKREGKEEEIEERENHGGKESSRGVENMG